MAACLDMRRAGAEPARCIPKAISAVPCSAERRGTQPARRESMPYRALIVPFGNNVDTAPFWTTTSVPSAISSVT